MELASFFGVVRRWLWLIVLGTLITAGMGYAVVKSTPTQYSATASVWVSASGIPGFYSSATDLETFAQTYAELIPTTPIVQQALDTTGDKTPVETVLKEIVARSIPRTAIIEIVVTDRNPERAAQLANATAEAFATSAVTSATRIAIAAPATVPTVSTDKRMGPIGILLAAIIGFAVVTGASFVLDHADDRVRSPSDLEDELGVRYLGALPRVRSRFGRAKSGWSFDPSSELADTYRRIRPGILRTFHELSKSVLLAAPAASADRGPVILNLAATLAEAGVRVAVVDADPFNPWLAPFLGLPENVGLVDLIERPNLSVIDVAHALNSPRISVVTAGTGSSASASALSSPRVQHVIREIERSADVILIGCAPVLARSDAGTLAPHVGQAILVVDVNRERRDSILGAEADLTQSGTTVAGAIILNLSASDLRRTPRTRRSMAAFDPVNGASLATNGSRHPLIAAAEPEIAMKNHHNA